jgi:hypothetical protein
MQVEILQQACDPSRKREYMCLALFNTLFWDGSKRLARSCQWRSWPSKSMGSDWIIGVISVMNSTCSAITKKSLGLAESNAPTAAPPLGPALHTAVVAPHGAVCGFCKRPKRNSCDCELYSIRQLFIFVSKPCIYRAPWQIRRLT